MEVLPPRTSTAQPAKQLPNPPPPAPDSQSAIPKISVSQSVRENNDRDRQDLDNGSASASTDGNLSIIQLEEWQLCEVPRPLSLVHDNTTLEIKRIVHDFWQQCEAIQASASTFHSSPQMASPPEAPPTSSRRPLSVESATNSDYSALKSPSESARRSSMSSISSNSIDTSPNKGKTPIRNRPTLDARPSAESTSRRSALRKFFKAKGSNVANLHLHNDASYKASSAVPALTRTLPRQATMTVECASCFDDIPAPVAISLTCQHHYCSDCFTHLVQSAMQHENFWPPKCCLEPIPRKTILKTIPPQIVKEFGIKEREFATPPKDRWYCTNTKCGLWFQATSNLGSYKRCPHCKYEMCVHCRGERHQGVERCVQDRGLQALEAEAELEGWRRCNRCGVIIERNRGCRHITCTCGAQFCYICAAPWRTCGCTEVDEHRRQVGLRERRETARREEHERQTAAETEEAELQAALQAVAEAGRREREQEMREEQRAIELMEKQRLEAIAAHYAKLREEMLSLHDHQVSEIGKGQAKTAMEHQRSLMVLARKRNQLREDIDIKRMEYEYQLHAARSALEANEHAIAARHFAQSAEMRRRLSRYVEEERMSEPERHHCLDSLKIEQTRELEEQRKQQFREIQKLDWRMQNADTFPMFVRVHEELEQKEQAAREAMMGMDERKENDSKWVDFANLGRESLLNEDEQRVRESGAEVPGMTRLTLEELMQVVKEQGLLETTEDPSMHSSEGHGSPGPNQDMMAHLSINCDDDIRDCVASSSRRPSEVSGRASDVSGRPSDVSGATNSTLDLSNRAWPLPPSTFEGLLCGDPGSLAIFRDD